MECSILILTKNEEKDLPGCIETLKWSDDIILYDSFSNDKTLEIAKNNGLRIVQRSFDNWSSHQNWGLRNIDFKYKWVLYIDADERLTDPLIEEIKNIKDPSGNAFKIRRRDYLEGKHLKYVQSSQWYIRLFKPEAISYTRLVNPITHVKGHSKKLKGYINHYPFSKGIEHWIKKHNSYSTFEAEEILKNKNKKINLNISSLIFEKDILKKRSQQKIFFYKLPFRPFIKFILIYFLKLGFLDGKEGFKYSILQSIYEYFIVLKTHEKSQNDKYNIRKKIN